jgi:hypothetical protein
MSSIVDQPEAIATNAIHVGIDDGDRDRRRDRGVDGIAAISKHGEA